MIFARKMRTRRLPREAAGFFLWALSFAVLPADAQTREAFRPDHMNTVLYGVAYYTEYMPYDRVDQDARGGTSDQSFSRWPHNPGWKLEWERYSQWLTTDFLAWQSQKCQCQCQYSTMLAPDAACV